MSSWPAATRLGAAFNGHCEFDHGLLPWCDIFNQFEPFKSRLLTRHPHVLRRLRSEIEEICGIGRDALAPTREDLKRMSFLQNVIKEGM